MNTETEDYFRSLIGVVGTKIHISHAEDFPDPTSGSFSDIVVSTNTETFIHIAPTVIKADDSVKRYPVAKVKEQKKYFAISLLSVCYREDVILIWKRQQLWATIRKAIVS